MERPYFADTRRRLPLWSGATWEANDGCTMIGHAWRFDKDYGNPNERIGAPMVILGIVYVMGVAVCGANYIQNGVFMAWDERPWWLAALHTLLWPVFLAAELLTSLGSR